jgi:hypothetical protein
MDIPDGRTSGFDKCSVVIRFNLITGGYCFIFRALPVGSRGTSQPHLLGQSHCHDIHHSRDSCGGCAIWVCQSYTLQVSSIPALAFVTDTIAAA